MVSKRRDRSLVRRRTARAVQAGARPDRSVLGPVMIKIAISKAAFAAISSTLALGSVGYENQTNERGERLVWLEPTSSTASGPCAGRGKLQRRDPAADGRGETVMTMRAQIIATAFVGVSGPAPRVPSFALPERPFESGGRRKAGPEPPGGFPIAGFGPRLPFLVGEKNSWFGVPVGFRTWKNNPRPGRGRPWPLFSPHW